MLCCIIKAKRHSARNLAQLLVGVGWLCLRRSSTGVPLSSILRVCIKLRWGGVGGTEGSLRKKRVLYYIMRTRLKDTPVRNLVIAQLLISSGSPWLSFFNPPCVCIKLGHLRVKEGP